MAPKRQARFIAETSPRQEPEPDLHESSGSLISNLQNLLFEDILRRLHEAHDEQFLALRWENARLRHENAELRREFFAEFGALPETPSASSSAAHIGAATAEGAFPLVGADGAATDFQLDTSLTAADHVDFSTWTAGMDETLLDLNMSSSHAASSHEALGTATGTEELDAAAAFSTWAAGVEDAPLGAVSGGAAPVSNSDALAADASPSKPERSNVDSGTVTAIAEVGTAADVAITGCDSVVQGSDVDSGAAAAIADVGTAADVAMTGRGSVVQGSNVDSQTAAAIADVGTAPDVAMTGTDKIDCSNGIPEKSQDSAKELVVNVGADSSGSARSPQEVCVEGADEVEPDAKRQRLTGDPAGIPWFDHEMTSEVMCHACRSIVTIFHDDAWHWEGVDVEGDEHKALCRSCSTSITTVLTLRDGQLRFRCTETQIETTQNIELKSPGTVLLQDEKVQEAASHHEEVSDRVDGAVSQPPAETTTPPASGEEPTIKDQGFSTSGSREAAEAVANNAEATVKVEGASASEGAASAAVQSQEPAVRMMDGEGSVPMADDKDGNADAAAADREGPVVRAENASTCPESDGSLPAAAGEEPAVKDGAVSTSAGGLSAKSMARPPQSLLADQSPSPDVVGASQPSLHDAAQAIGEGAESLPQDDDATRPSNPWAKAKSKAMPQSIVQLKAKSMPRPPQANANPLESAAAAESVVDLVTLETEESGMLEALESFEDDMLLEDELSLNGSPDEGLGFQEDTGGADLHEVRFGELLFALRQVHEVHSDTLRAHVEEAAQNHGKTLENEEEVVPVRSKDLQVILGLNSLANTTADSWNRLRDKARIEGNLGLSEKGNSMAVFVDPKDPHLVVARGYNRVLYGDHGPYLEFTPDQVNWNAFPNVKRKHHPKSYYDEHYTASLFVKAYEQKRTVRDKPNPPREGRWAVSNNRRKTGYAGYQPGKIYISADALQVVRCTWACLEDMGDRFQASVFASRTESMDESDREALDAVMNGLLEGMPPDVLGQSQWLQWSSAWQPRLVGCHYEAFVESHPELLLRIACPEPYRHLVLPTPAAAQSGDAFGKGFWALHIEWCRSRREEATEMLEEEIWHRVQMRIGELASQSGHDVDDIFEEQLRLPEEELHFSIAQHEQQLGEQVELQTHAMDMEMLFDNEPLHGLPDPEVVLALKPTPSTTSKAAASAFPPAALSKAAPSAPVSLAAAMSKAAPSGPPPPALSLAPSASVSMAASASKSAPQSKAAGAMKRKAATVMEAKPKKQPVFFMPMPGPGPEEPAVSDMAVPMLAAAKPKSGPLSSPSALLSPLFMPAGAEIGGTSADDTPTFESSTGLEQTGAQAIDLEALQKEPDDACMLEDLVKEGTASSLLEEPSRQAEGVGTFEEKLQPTDVAAALADASQPAEATPLPEVSSRPADATSACEASSHPADIIPAFGVASHVADGNSAHEATPAAPEVGMAIDVVAESAKTPLASEAEKPTDGVESCADAAEATPVPAEAGMAVDAAAEIVASPLASDAEKLIEGLTSCADATVPAPPEAGMAIDAVVESVETPLTSEAEKPTDGVENDADDAEATPVPAEAGMAVDAVAETVEPPSASDAEKFIEGLTSCDNAAEAMPAPSEVGMTIDAVEEMVEPPVASEAEKPTCGLETCADAAEGTPVPAEAGMAIDAVAETVEPPSASDAEKLIEGLTSCDNAAEAMSAPPEVGIAIDAVVETAAPPLASDAEKLIEGFTSCADAAEAMPAPPEVGMAIDVVAETVELPVASEAEKPTEGPTTCADSADKAATPEHEKSSDAVAKDAVLLPASDAEKPGEAEVECADVARAKAVALEAQKDIEVVADSAEALVTPTVERHGDVGEELADEAEGRAALSEVYVLAEAVQAPVSMEVEKDCEAVIEKADVVKAKAAVPEVQKTDDVVTDNAEVLPAEATDAAPEVNKDGNAVAPDVSLSSPTENRIEIVAESAHVPEIVRRDADPVCLQASTQKSEPVAGQDSMQQMLAIVMKLLSNVIDQPSEDKFRTLKTSNKVLRTKVFAVHGGRDFLIAGGFAEQDAGEVLRFDPSKRAAALAVREVLSKRVQLAPSCDSLEEEPHSIPV